METHRGSKTFTREHDVGVTLTHEAWADGCGGVLVARHDLM